MCENGPIIESRNGNGNLVLLCSGCGQVFVVIHACEVHTVIETDDAVMVMGDMNSECVGPVEEGDEVAAARVAAENQLARVRDLAEWN